MNAKRIILIASLIASALTVACADRPFAHAPESSRATPPPTAYIGTIIATPVPSTDTPASFDETYELALISNMSTAVAQASPAAPPVSDVAPVAPLLRTPRSGTGLHARVVDRVATTEKRVALTFDAGADRGYAEQILDTLRDAGVRASFGMTGQWAESNPDLLRRMVAEGHHFINHTQTHDSFTGVSTGRGPKSSEARAKELELTEQAVLRIAGASTKPYFRPPYGDLDASVTEDVQMQGYEIVAMWTVDSQGWNGLSRTAIEARCLRMAVPGAVYIFHVGSAAQDGPALTGVIEGLRKQGYQMGTLDWLLRP